MDPVLVFGKKMSMCGARLKGEKLGRKYNLGLHFMPSHISVRSLQHSTVPSRKVDVHTVRKVRDSHS